MRNNKINVFSEIGRLKVVLTHRPNIEVENIAWIPKFSSISQKWKFEGVMYLKKAQEEHDKFTSIMRENGVKVLYIENLAAETVAFSAKIKEDLIIQFVEEAQIKGDASYNFHNYLKLKEYFLALEPSEMIKKMIGGVKKSELNIQLKLENENPFICEPLPNILFQRDPFASIGNGIALNKMNFPIRNRETIFADFIFNYHPEFKGVKKYYHRNEKFSLEGGDILVLNKETLMFGLTERTEISAVEKVIDYLKEQQTSFKKIITIDLTEKSRRFMHLDTIFTNIDHHVFLVHPIIFDDHKQFKIYQYDLNLEIKKPKLIEKKLKDYLSEIIGKEALFIYCGRKNNFHPDIVNETREQFDDATNVVTLRPGVVIAYERNRITNQLLRENNITVLEIPSSELSRGLGGPRCMTMPIYRDDIE